MRLNVSLRTGVIDEEALELTMSMCMTSTGILRVQLYHVMKDTVPRVLHSICTFDLEVDLERCHRETQFWITDDNKLPMAVLEEKRRADNLLALDVRFAAAIVDQKLAADADAAVRARIRCEAEKTAAHDGRDLGAYTAAVVEAEAVMRPACIPRRVKSASSSKTALLPNNKRKAEEEEHCTIVIDDD